MLELDILRGFAMLVVVSSHVSSISIENLISGRGHFLTSMLHSSFNFSVPIFFIVGAALSARSVAGRKVDIWPYYKKKLIRIILPYLAWTLIYTLFKIAISKTTWDDLLVFNNWFEWISQGRAYDHLYYLIVIGQFHLLFPLLIKLARLVKDKPFWAFVIVIAGHNIVYWLNKFWLADVFPYFASSFFWHFSLFFLGLYLGLNYEKVCLWLKRNLKWALIVCVASAAGFLYMAYLLYYNNYSIIPQFNYFYSTIRLVYVTSLPLCLLAAARNPRFIHGPPGRCLLWIGRYSFGIYLAHPILNYFVRSWVTSNDVTILFFVSVLAVVALIIICGFLSKLLELFRPTAWLVGVKARRGPSLSDHKPHIGNFHKPM